MMMYDTMYNRKSRKTPLNTGLSEDSMQRNNETFLDLKGLMHLIFNLMTSKYLCKNTKNHLYHYIIIQKPL